MRWCGSGIALDSRALDYLGPLMPHSLKRGLVHPGGRRSQRMDSFILECSCGWVGGPGAHGPYRLTRVCHLHSRRAEAVGRQDDGRAELAAGKARLGPLQIDLQKQSRLLEDRAADAAAAYEVAERGARRWSATVSELQDTKRLRLEVRSEQLMPGSCSSCRRVGREKTSLMQHPVNAVLSALPLPSAALQELNRRRPGIARAAEWVEANQDRFRGAVLGPLAVSIEISRIEHAQALECHVPGGGYYGGGGKQAERPLLRVCTRMIRWRRGMWRSAWRRARRETAGGCSCGIGGTCSRKGRGSQRPTFAGRCGLRASLNVPEARRLPSPSPPPCQPTSGRTLSSSIARIRTC